MSEDSETQILSRLVDATRQAADCADQMCRSMAMFMPSEPRTLMKFRASLRQASGCAHQLAHAQQNPAFLALRDQLDQTTKLATGMGMSRDPKAGLAMAMVGTVLDKLWRTAEKTATSKSVPRAEVLAMLDRRQAAAVTH